LFKFNIYFIFKFFFIFFDCLCSGVSAMLPFSALAKAPQNNPADKTVVPVTYNLVHIDTWICETFVSSFVTSAFNATAAAPVVPAMSVCQAMQPRSARMALSLTRKQMGAHYFDSVGSHLLCLVH
jgi:hypothetical protein